MKVKPVIPHVGTHRETPIASAEIGHCSTTICHLGKIVVRPGRKFHWDSKNERFIGDDKANAMLYAGIRDPWGMAELRLPVLASSK